MRRQLELAECWEGGVTKDSLEQIMNKWGELEKASPDIPNDLYDAAKDKIDKDALAKANPK